MEIPADLRRLPPRSSLDWVAAAIGPGARVAAVHRLANAWAAAVHAVDVDDEQGHRHELVMRRWARTDQPFQPGLVENEAAALSLLASASAVRAPDLVASDPVAEFTDVPALVMTRLPGDSVFSPPDLDEFLDGLVAALNSVHAAAITEAGVGLSNYRPWGLERPPDPPRWSRRPDVWRRAFEIARRPVPAYAPVLCHRDFHPGNVLWHDGCVSGVVDWTHTCVGPAAADVAHCRLNLAVLFDLDVADDFASRYGPIADLAWFDLIDVVGFGELDAWRWHEAGRVDISDETVARSLDGFVAAAVGRLS